MYQWMNNTTIYLCYKQQAQLHITWQAMHMTISFSTYIQAKESSKQMDITAMQAELIETIHQLAAVCKKYEGIVFTDKDWIIIEDKNDPKDEILELQEWTNKILQSGHTTKYNKNVHTTENYRHGQTSK